MACCTDRRCEACRLADEAINEILDEEETVMMLIAWLKIFAR